VHPPYLTTTVEKSSKELATKRRAPGSGLRQFAMSVLQKVERKGQTTYHEVADELVREVVYDNKRPRPPQVLSLSLSLSDCKQGSK